MPSQRPSLDDEGEAGAALPIFSQEPRDAVDQQLDAAIIDSRSFAVIDNVP